MKKNYNNKNYNNNAYNGYKKSSRDFIERIIIERAKKDAELQRYADEYMDKAIDHLFAERFCKACFALKNVLDLSQDIVQRIAAKHLLDLAEIADGLPNDDMVAAKKELRKVLDQSISFHKG